MAEKRLIGRNLSESDIEFFRRELKSREPSQLTLITGTGDEAQKVLRDMIDAGASIQDGKLSDKHEAAVDEKKIRIEETIRIEGILEQDTMAGMTPSKRRDMWPQTGYIEIDYVKELKRAIDTYGFHECVDETSQDANFSLDEFCRRHYPKNSQAYLDEVEFYCRKARVYRVKEQVAVTRAKNNEERRKNVLHKLAKEHSEVSYYCLQEAAYWKLKAEIYYNSEQDKKRIQDPTKSSSCRIHSENDVTKYVYIPIKASNFDLELTKVGLGAHNGVTNVMLVVKEIDECKKQNTLDMMVMLSIYGAPFKDRGVIMVTEECKRNVNNSDIEYFKNKTTSEEYLDIIRLIANEERIFLLDRKILDPNKLQTNIKEFFKFTLRVTKDEKYQNDLSEIGKKLYGEITANNKGLEFHVNDARDKVDELRVCDKVLTELKNVQEFFSKQLAKIKLCLNKCNNKENPNYLQTMEIYEMFKKQEKTPFYEDNPENYLNAIVTAIILEKCKIADAAILTEDILAIPDKTDPNQHNTVKAVATVSGIGVSTSAGAGIGATIGIIGGPIGMALGGAIGGATGGAVGGISAAIGYAVAKNKKKSKK